MRKLVYTLSLAMFVMITLMACGEKGNPKEYNDKLIGIQNTVIKEFLELSNTFASNDKAKIDVAYAKALKVTADAVEAIKKEGPYDGDDTFRQKLQALLEFYKSIVEKEYKEMIDILAKGAEITPEDMAKLEELQKSITEREKGLDAEMLKAQSDFATKHGVGLKENEYQKDIDKMNK